MKSKIKRHLLRGRVYAACLMAFLFSALSLRAAEPLALATGGKALIPIVIMDSTSNQLVSAAATDLAAFLEQISGAPFAVRRAGALPEGPAVVVGTSRQFPELNLARELPLNGVVDREHYIVRVDGQRLLLVGTTELAAEHAVYRLLEHLGCRWFFPGENWEVIPKIPELSVSADFEERPDYLTRAFVVNESRNWGFAPLSELWKKRNRMANSLNVSAGDGSYGRFAVRQAALFKAHPEYRALVNGKRTPRGNFCISNPELRARFTEDVLKQFQDRPELDMASVGPDDTPVWCACEACVALGSPSDRAVTLANEVQAAVGEEFPDKSVGMYAYSAWVDPPTIRVDPRICVPVTTKYISQPHEEILAAWHRQGASVAVREYSSVYIWDYALPWTRARAADLSYWREMIPHWHRDFDIRIFTTETVANWGLFGLATYVSNKLLWDVNTDVDGVVNDFLTQCFGRGAAPLRAFYELIGGANKDQPSDDYMGRLYRCLAEARTLEDDPAVVARLNDLTLYLRYVDYFMAYSDALHYPRNDVPRETCAQKEFEEMLRFTWKIRSTCMVDWVQNWRWLQRFGGFAWPGGVSMGDFRKALYAAKKAGTVLSKEEKAALVGLLWSTPENEHPWKEPGRYTVREIEEMNAWGGQQHPLLGIAPIAYSDDLIPAGFAAGPPREEVMQGNRGGITMLYLWKDAGSPLPALTFNCGFVYGPGEPLPWRLYDAEDSVVATGEVPRNEKTDRTEHTVTFDVTRPGLYRFEWIDHGVGTYLRWSQSAKVCFAASPKYPGKFNYGVASSEKGRKGRLYFYVPRAVEQVVIYRNSNPFPWIFYDHNDQLIASVAGGQGHIVVPAPPALRGTVWSVERVSGRQIEFLTTPPVWALAPEELLLPREVVRADGLPGSRQAK